MSFLQAILIALLHGIGETLPVGSSGPLAALLGLTDWPADIWAPEWGAFRTALHLGLALALLLYFWKDWWNFAIGLVGGAAHERDFSRRVLVMLAVALLPALAAATLGQLVRPYLQKPLIASCGLLVNAALLFGVELYYRQRDDQGQRQANLRLLTWKSALIVGLSQFFSVLPGLGRFGLAMVAGLIGGLSHRAAAHFGFLLLTPLMLISAASGLMKLRHPPEGLVRPPHLLELSLVAGVVTAIISYFTISLLMHYFRKHDAHGLDGFSVISGVLGGGVTIWLIAALL